MASVYSVGQVNTYIKNMFTQDILLTRLTVKGEVSNCKYHTSGHIYFTIKDEAGTLGAVMFAGNRKGLAFRLSDGQKVLVTGNIGVYERDGKYQMYAASIVLDGEGDLFARYQKLKAELEEMGMFDASYKKPIPRFARTIGIVTASTGAAIRDIINISSRRNPYVQLVLYPAIVQGEYAAESIVKGIEYLDNYGVDTIIIGRGGGSIEDLWAFNEEIVARAVFNCSTPVISAVGHETDYTIADFVSDLRAPTPSAAAELAVFDINHFSSMLDNYRQDLLHAVTGRLSAYRNILNQYQVSFKFLNPQAVLNDKKITLSSYEDSLKRLMNLAIEKKRNTLALLSGSLNANSPLKKISSGYAYVSDTQDNKVSRAAGVNKGDKLKLTLADGVILSEVLETNTQNL
jgi:exodeoxyribonuclease VII large subunit